ncbi:uncharacterized protein DUF1488|uniref:Uncharacterized protein DUF1488 n=1 Tax=Brenneria salicis ATCC 15712 = DSM 30166 TaxID=714314 RepID=A0A366HXP2_9GAMM|nr:DUF1488 domain-containing protein [Brenneria salicis]NMN90366.1 uncharacterized protein DUF1488 [Brenneria salicis ATCC 15712 = DSM 30166]RBP58533.1 uncharacterized protein DUF1488 [Brenneria salicis ATCC 15712 = DSM 30166]RLM29927.1 hypothetical protein BHG07_13715 [Brenneria salicis ATCC 15712 = DSM 30166]
MNQAIQFPDRESWDEALQAIRFPVLVNGFQQECIIGIELLRRHYGNVSPEQFLDLFRENRWDFEDVFEKMVFNQEHDEQGYFSLS